MHIGQNQASNAGSHAGHVSQKDKKKQADESDVNLEEILKDISHLVFKIY